MSDVVRFGDGGGLRPKIGNAVFGVLLRSPMAARLDPMWLLDMQGRRTGRRIRTPVALHEVEGQKLFTSGGRWRFNFADGGYPFSLRRGSERVTGSGTLVTGLDRTVEVFEKLMHKYEAEHDLATASRFTGARLEAGRLPTTDELRDVLATAARGIVEVELD